MYIIIKYPHLLTIGSLAGTIIGVGMFGIPYVAMKAGVLPVIFYLAIFGAVSILIHAMYMEIVLRTKENHRLAGYSEIYLGNKWKWITLIQTVIFLWGSLLIYTIVGGQFLNIIFEPFFGNTTLISSLAFFAIASFVVIRGIRAIGKIEVIFTIIIVIAVILFFARSLLLGNIINLSQFIAIDWKNIILPYGVVLFAMSGLSIIPSLKNEVETNIALGQKLYFGKIILIGTAIPAFVYLLFMFSIIGISGDKTTQDALTGLDISSIYLTMGAVIGIFAMFTSFIALGNELKRTFLEDFGVPIFWSTIGSLLAPLIMFLLGLNDFIIITSFVGSFGAIYINIIIFIIHKKAKKMGDEKNPLFSFNISNPILWLLSLIFIIGFIVSIMELF